MYLTPREIEALDAQPEILPLMSKDAKSGILKTDSDQSGASNDSADSVTSSAYKILKKKIKENASINQEQLQNFVGIRPVRQHASVKRRTKHLATVSSKGSSKDSIELSMPKETEEILMDLSLIEEDYMIDIRLKDANLACAGRAPALAETDEDRWDSEEPRALVFDETRDKQENSREFIERELLPAPLYKKKKVPFMTDLYIQEIRKRAKQQSIDESGKESATSEPTQDDKSSIIKTKKLFGHDSLHHDEGNLEGTSATTPADSKQNEATVDGKTAKRLSPKNQKVQESIKRIRERLNLHNEIDLDVYTKESEYSSTVTDSRADVDIDEYESPNSRVHETVEDLDYPRPPQSSCWNLDDIWFGVDSDIPESMVETSGQHYAV